MGMQAMWLVFVGGGVGSVLRVGLSLLTQRVWVWQAFPLGTLLVNLLGCALMGFLAARVQDGVARWLLMSGFCGGFTTFSAFGLESLALWQSGQYGTLALYVVLSMVLGVAAVYAGMYGGLRAG